MSPILEELKKDLLKHVDPVYKDGAQRFFKEDVSIMGVRTPIIRKFSREYFKKIKDLSKKEIFALSEELLQPNDLGLQIIGFDWAYRIKDRFTPSDFSTFERWLKKYVTNWASCDDFCNHPLGHLITTNPELLPKVKKWTKSKNRWMRRAAAVCLIPGVRKKQYLKDIFEVSDVMLMDEDDLVQKGYGWALKEASNKFPAEVFRFVMKRKDKMPRTALRYAIEKYPKEMKKEAMKK